jgi:hypothetical protein
MGTQKTLSWLVALAGLWEVLAPFFLGYSASTAALWDAIIIGVTLIVLGAWAAISNQISTDKTLNWINVALGVWLVIAPFIFGYVAVAAALWNDIIVGIIAVVLAGWAAITIGRQHSGTA